MTIARRARAVPGDAHGGSRPADGEAWVPIEGPYRLAATLAIHRRGAGDPTLRIQASGAVWRATRTADGPVTLFLQPATGGVRARAWGPGTAAALERLAALLGGDDDPGALVPRDTLVAEAARRQRGIRFGRGWSVLEALVPAILEQKVTGDEARRAYRALVRVHGEDAPGPPGLRLPPAPSTLAAIPYHAFHPLGVERRRADLIRAVSAQAPRLEGLAEATEGPADERAAGLERAYAVLRSFPGIGPWTAAEVGQRAFGDADAVSVGDFHLPSVVTWALAREPRGSDARMLELLEPYRGQRGRVTRILELSGFGPPRRAPRLAPRRIEAL